MQKTDVHEKGVHTHRINVSKVVDCRDVYLAELVAGKRVVHIGCADSPFTQEKLKSGGLLHEKLVPYAATFIGVDIDEEAIEYLQVKRPDWKLVCADVQTTVVDEISDGCDIVLFPEVIEHLSNPGKFLDGLARSMCEHSTLVITTPNALSWRTMLRALLGKETLHQDHVLAFTPSTITQLLSRHGFVVCDMLGYGKGWSPQVVKRLLAQPVRLWHKFNNASIDGLIVHAKKAS